jgi:predicted DsbA family dithiol-disulfide isomerase
VSLQPLKEKGTMIEWKPWKMPGDANPPSKPDGYGEQAGVYLNELLTKHGLTIKRPSERRPTELAHIGGKYAAERGKFEAYNRRIFEAVWLHDENIADVEVLLTIGEEVGLDRAGLKQALESNDFKEKVEADYRLAVQERIWTIPAYVGPKGEIQVHHFQDMPSIEQLHRILD